jgi:hypothetical protein
VLPWWGRGQSLLRVAGVVFAPLLHAPSVLGATEIIPVRGLAQPAALAGGLTGAPTLKLRTIILVTTVAVIRTETLAAMPAPTSVAFGIHCKKNQTRQSEELKPTARICKGKVVTHT